MKCAVEIDSDAMIHIPGLIKIGSGIQKLMGGYTDSMVEAYFYFLHLLI
jgi:hypothetical protein